MEHAIVHLAPSLHNYQSNYSYPVAPQHENNFPRIVQMASKLDIYIYICMEYIFNGRLQGHQLRVSLLKLKASNKKAGNYDVTITRQWEGCLGRYIATSHSFVQPSRKKFRFVFFYYIFYNLAKHLAKRWEEEDLITSF